MRLIDADAFFENYPELAIEPYINAPTVETSGDLISRSVLKKAYFNAIEKSSIGEVSIVNLIDNATTVCAENVDKVMIEHETIALSKGLQMGYEQARKDFERPQGKWARHDEWVGGEYVGGFYHVNCPEIEKETALYSRWTTNFCPNCGAEMRGGES